MAEISPFSAKRYEHAGSHVYYIPPEAFRLLEAAVPTYLVGTRGTGKTTLLRALSWDERLYNLSLHAQLGTQAFEQQYVGLYFKLPNVQLELIDRWLREEPDSDYAAIVAFYLDLCWLETARFALRHLAAQGVVELTRAAEEQFLIGFRETWNSYPSCSELFGEPGASISEVLDLMHPMRRGVERFARRRTPPADVLDALPIGQIGSFGRRVGLLLSQALDECPGSKRSIKWSFRVCMDEGEVLTLRQQRVINSMVRLAEWPVFQLVAYVSRPLDATGTFLPNQTLQHADRQILVRDDMSDRAFKELAEGVVNVRIRTILPKRTRLSTTRLLGKLSIDDLLRRVLGTSEDIEIQALLTRAEALAATDDNPPPIYETYLRTRRPELAEVDTTSAFQRRRQSSASIRKQMVAAYLSLCREAGARPMYASADMLFQVADKCVRDYLWQMESIFALADMPLEEFLRSEVPVERQSEGMRAAAALKMTLFRERVLSAPAEANQFVDGLARITALIQSTGRNYEQLRTPERGIFSYRLRRSGPDQAGSDHPALIRDAAEAGFLRLLGDSELEELRFRVHASLAPQYDFSYRGAYYPAGELSDADILSLRSASTSRSMAGAVNSIVARITGRRVKSPSGNQLRFDNNGEEDA